MIAPFCSLQGKGWHTPPGRRNRPDRCSLSSQGSPVGGCLCDAQVPRNGLVEQIRILLVARRSARSQRIQTLNQLRHLVFTGPETIRVRFKDRYKTSLVTEVAKLRPRKGSDPVLFTTQTTMRGLARRIQKFNTEIKHLDSMLIELVAETAPSLVGLYGVGTDTAATLLTTAGDNPQRLRSERSWAHLCGVCPIPRSPSLDSVSTRRMIPSDRHGVLSILT